MKTITKNLFILTIFILIVILVPVENLKGQALPYQNPKLGTEERVRDLLSRMTIEEKINQMLKVSLAELKQNEQGEITEESLEELFKGESIGCLDPPRWNDLTDRPIDVEGIAKFSEAADRYLRTKTRLGIPAIQVDLGGIHGQLAYDATIFPQTIGQGSTWNIDLIREMAGVMAKEAKLTGCNQFFAPLLDIARDPRYGRVEECFGEDPFHVAEMGKAFIIGMQGDPEITKNRIPENKIISTAKHYVGYSTPIAGINIAPFEVGPRDFRDLHLYPFERAVREANVYSIMPAYNEVNGIPVHANKTLLRDILRKEFGFKGYVFADYGGVSMIHRRHKLTADKAETAVVALKAGVDQEGNNWAYSELINLAKKDKEIAALVDGAVTNMLTVKFKAGLFDQPYKAPENISRMINTDESRKLSRYIAEESIILLKNENNLLPLNLSELKSIAVIGPNADQVQYGDYSITKDNETGVTILEGIKKITGGNIPVNYARGCGITDLDKSGFQEAIDAAAKSDVVVLVIGGTSMSLAGTGWGEMADEGAYPTSGEGYDRSELTPPGVQQELIKEIYKTGKPVIMVMVHGRAYAIKWEKENIPAILEAWYPGSEGGNAVARILFGEVNPSGKLTVSVPQSEGHIPVFYNYKPTGRGFYHKPGTPEQPGRDYVFSSTDPLFPFGYGLSYTTFEYSNLKIKQKKLSDDGNVELSVSVKNTGNMEGKEVVQVYINDKISSVTTPVIVLKGFKKVNIKPGETVTVDFKIPCRELGLWDKNMEYVIEPGDFDIMIGASAEDIRLTDTITISAAVDKSGNLSVGWAQADITPDKPVLIAGQFHARVSEGVMDPVTATVLALESGSGESSEKVLLISCDLVGISDGTRDDAKGNLRNTIREKITGKIPGISPEKIIINATHTHAAPYCHNATSTEELYGVELDVMSPAECIQFVSEKISEAAEQAWEKRTPGGISYGLGHAVVSHNRLQVGLDGKSTLYGNTNRKDFSHIEGYEDHSVNLLYTWDNQDNLTGIVVNVPGPSQVTEGLFVISADYWHDTRVEIRKRLGENIFILPQCSASGDQSPHILLGSKAETRMQKLMFPELEEVSDRIVRRKVIAVRIADAVTSVLPYMKNNINWNPTLIHKLEVVELSRRLIGPEDVNEGQKEAEKWENEYNKLLKEINENPALKEKPRWYTQITSAYSRMRRGTSVKDRFELEKVQSKMAAEVHILRIGDIVMATNPFEYYLDYGMRIKARSSAIQTFQVQLAGSGSYIPTTRSVEGGAYGAVPASTLIGPEGGQELVERTLQLIDEVMK